MLSILLALIALTGALPPRQVDAITRVRAIVQQATLAVNGDSAARVRERWAMAGGNDGEAQLGLATLARLTYDFTDAERRYTRLLGDAEPTTPLQLYAALGRALSLAQRWQSEPALAGFRVAYAAAKRLADARGQTEALLGMTGYIRAPQVRIRRSRCWPPPHARCLRRMKCCAAACAVPRH